MRRWIAVLPILFLFVWMFSRSRSHEGGTGDPLRAGEGGRARCVWNQAYQENYAADAISDILAGARDCYVLIDAFPDAEVREAIEALRDHQNLVGCYMSSGTCEDWRRDFSAIKPYCVEQAWGEWDGEYFVDRTDPALVALMKARIDDMAGWGCDLVEFDNMDWAFDEELRVEYGFRASEADAISYNQALCAYARSRGMGCMAKNTRTGAEDFDGVTFESYSDDERWWPREDLAGFLDEDQPGVVMHYDETDCEAARQRYAAVYGNGLSFLCEDRGLEAYRRFASGRVFERFVPFSRRP
jgi:cysteinyl-tRNA synthetase